MVSSAAHGNGYIHATSAHRQHSESSASRRVRIGSNQSLARNAKSLIMNLVADAVARSREVHTVLCSHGLNIFVIICILKSRLQSIVIYICYGTLSLDLRNSHSLKLQIYHCSSRILCQSLVNPEPDLLTHLHLTTNKVSFNNFLSYCISHFMPPTNFLQTLQLRIYLQAHQSHLLR